jgi:hypothetical protein
MSYQHHLLQLKKNWGVFTLLLLVVFSAGVVWAFTERDFVEMETFEVHVQAEEKYIEEKFDAQEKLIQQKFENTDQKIEHLDEHLEEIKDLLKE